MREDKIKVRILENLWYSKIVLVGQMECWELVFDIRNGELKRFSLLVHSLSLIL